MVMVVQVTQNGGPEVLNIVEQATAEPGPGQVWIEQKAIGVNPLDLLQRKGVVPLPLPSPLGLEGAGEVRAVGPDVTGVRVGDRVAYATGPIGAYASGRIYPADRLVKLPDALGFDEAAVLLFKGITAQYLLKTTYPVGPGSRVLIYGASGGVGQLMAAWAKHLGAQVLGVVKRPGSVQRALDAGCDQAFVFDAATLPEQVAKATDGHKVDVVYDGVGKISFDASLDCLRPRGVMVSYGATSGAPDPVSVATLNAKGSLYLTRPSLAAHTATAEEYQQRAADVIAAWSAGLIKPQVAHRFALTDVAQAHALMESGRNDGAMVLVP